MHTSSQARSALAGLIGGLLVGPLWFGSDDLGALAALVRLDSPAVGLMLLLVLAALGGSGFGVLTQRQRSGAGEMLFWGLAYGSVLWFGGPLTCWPLLLGQSLRWEVGAARAAFPSLLGLLAYGACTGLALAVLRPAYTAGNPVDRRGALLRAAAAGLLAGALLGIMLQSQNRLLAVAAMMASQSSVVAWIVTLGIGVLAGCGFALLYPDDGDGAGPDLIRGTVYGFCWWVAGGLTLMPLASGAGIRWSADAARTGFAALPAYMLFGAALVLLYRWLGGLVRLLFSDSAGDDDDEGIGARGLRALSFGALAGLVGGLVFTVVMVQIGFLPVVASLVGSRSVVTGLAVHLLIACVIGASYSVLFRQKSYDFSAALGWGVSYGVLWWLLGPLTLLPILLGVAPRWNAEVAAGLMASLIGHVLYGAGLGIVTFLLEARYNPWWIPLSQAEAMRATRRTEQLRSSAPALWSLVVVIALTLPIILGM